MGGGGGSSGGAGRYREVTHPAARQRGHREYIDNETGLKSRYDPERGKNPEHWHVENPNKTDDSDYYLDKNGNPAERHSEEAALTPEEYKELMGKLKGGSKK